MKGMAGASPRAEGVRESRMLAERDERAQDEERDVQEDADCPGVEEPESQEGGWDRSVLPVPRPTVCRKTSH